MALSDLSTPEDGRGGIKTIQEYVIEQQGMNVDVPVGLYVRLE